MKLIDPSFEIIKQEIPVAKLDKDKYFIIGELIKSAKKQIELAGRVCYKSEDKITEDSYKQFFKTIRDKDHLSVFEHGTLYFRIVLGSPLYDDHYLWKANVIQFFKRNPYSRVVEVKENVTIEDGVNIDVQSFYITTNYRVIEENFNKKKVKVNSLMDEISEDALFDYLCIPTERHQKRISVRFICSRGISHELVRHRVFSFAQESQRYCNYSKGKYGMEVTFIKPQYFNDIPRFEESLIQSENNYFYLMGIGALPQEAREVLPNATKTEVIMTGYIDDWKEFFKLRTSKRAHPEMRRLIIPLQKEFEKYV